jgi:hypothetical protein
LVDRGELEPNHTTLLIGGTFHRFTFSPMVH